jgi:hypothetical protein
MDTVITFVRDTPQYLIDSAGTTAGWLDTHPWVCPAAFAAGVVLIVAGALRLSARHRRTGGQ